MLNRKHLLMILFLAATLPLVAAHAAETTGSTTALTTSARDNGATASATEGSVEGYGGPQKPLPLRSASCVSTGPTGKQSGPSCKALRHAQFRELPAIVVDPIINDRTVGARARAIRDR